MDKTLKRQSLEKILTSYKQCTDEKKKRLLHIKIVEQTLELVKKVATPIAVQTGMSTEDLLQVGALGLIKAIEFYEPDKNAKFETYANYFIKGEIRHYVRDKAGLIKIPRRVQELLCKIHSAKKILMEDGVDEPADELVAEYLNIPLSQLREVLNAEQYKSFIALDQTLSSSEDDDMPLLEKIPADSVGFNVPLEDKLTLSFAIEKLPAEQRQVIEMNFYQDLNQREIAQKLNISQMQVSRKLKKALNHMYEIIKGQL